MFTALSERLTAALKRLTGRGVLSEQDVTAALRDIRRHLLEADVSFEVAQGFAERVRERAIGAIAVKAAATMDAEAAQRLERKARSKQGMDLADFLVALKQMQALGPIKQVLGLLPGVNAQALKAVNADDKRLKHVEAIVLSMTPGERADPSVLTGSRRLRIAKGAGRTVQEVNRLLEQFQQMRKLLKRT